MHCRFHTAIDDIAANLWDALNVTGSPFLHTAVNSTFSAARPWCTGST